MYYRFSYNYRRRDGYRRRARAPRQPWIIAAALLVSVLLAVCFGYYHGNRTVVLGPSSSLMLAVSSVFVSQVLVREKAGGGLLLYGFSEAPEPSLQTRWNMSESFTVEPYSRRGFSFWLNRGSVVWIRWNVIGDGVDAGNIRMNLFKGERNARLLEQHPASSNLSRSEAGGSGRAECSIDEDDTYDIGGLNLNSRAVSLSMEVQILSKVHDLAGAVFVCSVAGGPCKMELPFPPATQYVVLVTPAPAGEEQPRNGWTVEISYVTRVFTYLGFLAFTVLLVFVIWFFLKHLHAGDGDGGAGAEEPAAPAPARGTETDPILAAPGKGAACAYGAMAEEDAEPGSGRSSDDLYDGKLCVICYEEARGCFFTPCGHCATCVPCAKRIMEEENKACPICRRLIHKARRLLFP